MLPNTCFMSVLKGTHSVPSHSEKCFSYFSVSVTHPSIYNSELHNHIKSGGEDSRASVAQVLGTPPEMFLELEICFRVFSQ